MTVRERVAAAQREIGAGNLEVTRACDLLDELSALVGNINVELMEADIEFATVLLECYEKEETANRANIRAETTDQYRRKREAKNTLKLAETLIAALKLRIRTAHEEMRLTR